MEWHFLQLKDEGDHASSPLASRLDVWRERCCSQTFEDVRQLLVEAAACPGGTGWAKDSAEYTARASIRAEPAEIRRVQGEVVPTNEEPALATSAANITCGAGQHHEASATWAPGQK